MKVWLRKRSDGTLEAASEKDEHFLANLKYGEEVCADFKKSRNPKFHRKYFALLNLGFENQDKYDEFEDFRTEVKLKTGFYKPHVTTKGIIIYVPKSIAFDKMDDLEFFELFSKTIDVILKYFIIGSTHEEINRQVDNVLAFT